jgi:hypothetical protein
VTQVYFHCSNPEKVFCCGGAMVDPAEAREHATLVMRSLIMTPSPEDWRNWVLHVIDADGYEIVSVPFAAVLGKPH